MKSKFPLLIIFSLSVLLLSACGDSQSEQRQAPAPVSVNAYKVTSEKVTGLDTYPGTVTPLNEVELRPQVSGYITNIYVNDGQKVKKGQKLYEVDRSKYQAAYKQAQASLQSSKANLMRIEKDVERYERLSEQEAIAQQQVDYARADLLTAQSQVSAAEAQLSSTATDLNYSVINAPFEGTIGISQVRVGAQVSPGQPLLNTISAEDPIAVDMVINEQEIPRFVKLRENTGEDSTFTIKLSDGSTYPRAGKLTVIDRAVGQSGTITIRLTFPNPESRLIPGTTVNVNVLNQDIGEQVVIPYRTVTEQMGEYFVYLIQGDSVVQRNVVLGTQVKELIVVREGVKEGETIVLEGIQRLREGAKVQVGSPQAQPQANNNQF